MGQKCQEVRSHLYRVARKDFKKETTEKGSEGCEGNNYMDS